MAQRLQAAAGNRALSGILAQRRTTAPAPESEAPAAAAVVEPEVPVPAVQRLSRPPAASTPKFNTLKSDVRGKQKTLAAHPPATSKASAAQAAAKPPADDKQAQGKAANAEKMNAAQPGVFDKAAFIAAVNKAIADQAPKNLDEADNFGESGKADAVKGQVQGKVGQGREQSAKAIETTTKAAPDTSAAKEKPVTPLVQEPAPAGPGVPDAGNALPDKAPASATDFSAGPAQVDQQMAGAQVTEEQLAKSNEPEFTGALKEKKAGEQHAATAPGEVRAAEAQTLAGAKADASATGAQAVAGMRGDKLAANNAVGKGQQGAQGKDESKRAQVTAKLQAVFDATQKDVEGILTGLDKKVDDAFSAGEKAARDSFTAEHKRRMDEYKDKRYSGFTGKLKWVKDKFAGLPEEANQIFVTARQGYVAKMQTVISNVADVIGGELTRAKQRIATGRQQLQAEVQKLPADLQAVGKEAAGEFAGKFDELTESVDAKGTELVNTLASKYNEALKSVDAEIEAEKEKNKGLIAKAVDAVKGVIDTILKLKDLLLGVLAKAAQAVMAILKDPIGFLGNLVSAVGAGLKAFMNNIGTHVKKGLIGWLLGTMQGAGIQLPDKFDLRGILSMIASLLGLTWGAIRGRIIAKGIPEQAMGAVEAGVPVVAKLQSQGVAGAYEEIKDQVGDLKENLLGKISEYLIPTVLIAGITWIISLLNPASAFIKACKMIIDIVTFIIERGAQIIEFVNAVLDAVIAIAGGGAGGVPALIEAALAKSIPVLIGALAAILGIGGIATKVKSFFQALSKPVMKAVDWVVGKIVGLGKKIWAKLKGKDKNKSADAASKDPAKERAAITDADKALRSSESTDQARKKVEAAERRHQVPLHLFVDSRTSEGDVVHVQTMSTPQRPIGAKEDEAEFERRYRVLRGKLTDVRAQMMLDQKCTGNRSINESIGPIIKPYERMSLPRAQELLIKEYENAVQHKGTGLPIEDIKRKIQQVKMSIDHAIALEKVRQLPECRDLLGTMQQMAAVLDAVSDEIARGDVNREHQEDAIRTQVNNILEQFVKEAKDHGYPSVAVLRHPSNYVLAGEIREKWRHTIRDTFYGKTYSAATMSWGAGEQTRLVKKAAADEYSALPHHGDPNCFYCEKCNEIRPLVTMKDGKKVKGITFDHDDPIAGHWTNLGGNNTNHKTRTDYYSLISNLVVMCQRCNSRKGSGGETYDPHVGPSFRGPGE
ncbi:hypothetical protein [Actinoplanes sp. NBRC 103695]|uniref:hypothetical protein n=1 Tax=Actinoplanes sp. NBRC 103695 TaxID=3032202 RepID=UPI0025536450|nr:hypothetical protein [Actinoplanes sp. NBRC 103695]